jgi:Uma2 family endonuclease
MTLDEFLAWDSGDPTGVPWQLIDGEPAAMVPGSAAHGELRTELAALLGNHLLGRAPCRSVIGPGVVPRALGATNYRIPDLAVTCEPPTRDQTIHQPVLLVEILSPSNEVETNADIWAFTTIPSVMEILAIHSTRISARVTPPFQCVSCRFSDGVSGVTTQSVQKRTPKQREGRGGYPGVTRKL